MTSSQPNQFQVQQPTQQQSQPQPALSSATSATSAASKVKPHVIARTHEFDYSNQQFDYGNPDRFITEESKGKHPLWSSFAFWMYKKQSLKAPLTNVQNAQQLDINALFANPSNISNPAPTTQSSEYQTYLDSFVKLGPISTVEDFWNYYVYLKRPQHNLEYSYHCFRADIEPTWEHPGNINGGKWSISLRRNYGPRLFEVILLSFIGNEYNLNDEICGVVLSIKKTEDVVSIWVKNSQDQGLIDRIRHIIKRYIYACYYAQPNTNTSRDQAPPVVSSVEFKPHQSALNKHQQTQIYGENGAPINGTISFTMERGTPSSIPMGSNVAFNSHLGGQSTSSSASQPIANSGTFERNQHRFERSERSGTGGGNKHYNNKRDNQPSNANSFQYNTNAGNDDFTFVKHTPTPAATTATTAPAPTSTKTAMSNNPFAMLEE